jgi:hypothetical protein
MDAKDNQRKEERYASKSSVKIAFYVPLEYEACYGANRFKAEIIDFSESGFGILLGDALEEKAVVTILPDQECPSEGKRPALQVYQSVVRWTKRAGPETFRIGVQHIR